MASEDGARARGEGWAWMTMPVLLTPLDPAYGWGEAAVAALGNVALLPDYAPVESISLCIAGLFSAW